MHALLLVLPFLAACASEAEPLEPADAGVTEAPPALQQAGARATRQGMLPRLPLGKRPLAPLPDLPDEPIDPSFITEECEPDESIEFCKKLCVVLTDVHDDNFYYYPADHSCKNYLTSEADF